MSSAKKVIISLIISILIFSVVAFISFAELFSVFETRFYQPAVIKGMEKRLKNISACLDEYTVIQAKEFSQFVDLSCIKTVSLLEQSESDIKDREKFSSELVLRNAGLQGVRIIDSNGKKILYSTFKTDNSEYNKNPELPYEAIKANDNPENKSKAKIVFDNSNERILYSIPFYDVYDLYRGSAIFYVAGIDFNRYLLAKQILSVSEQAKLVATVFSDSTKQYKGFVLGLPSVSSDVLVSKISDLWLQNSFDTQKILHSQDYNWFVISDNSGKTGIISLVFKDDILIFNTGIKVLFLLSVFITLFLIILLIFNLKQDDEAIIKDKIKRFKIALINEYLVGSGEEDWNEVSKFLTVRKHQINHDVKKYLGKKGEKHKILVENLLENTWADIEKIIISNEKSEEDFDDYDLLEQNYETLEDVQENSSNVIDLSLKQESEVLSEVEESEEIDEIVEIESINEVTELEPVELEPIEDFENSKKSDDSQEFGNFFHFNKDNTSSIADLNFEVQQPDFAILDEENSLNDDLDDIELFEETKQIEQIDQVEELEELEDLEPVSEFENTEEIYEHEVLQDIENNPEIENSSEDEIFPEADLEELNSIQIFSLVSNSSLSFYSASNLEELESVESLSKIQNEKSIVESETGLFFISKTVDTRNVKIDQNFQNLVDSVLQNTI